MLCFDGSSATKFLSLNNQSCITRATLIDLNPGEFCCLFMVQAGVMKVEYPPSRMCFCNKKEDVNLKVLNMTT